MPRFARIVACLAMLPALLAFHPAPARADQAKDYLLQTLATWDQREPAKALDQADLAVREIWKKVPLYLRNVVLTTERGTSYGIYKPRPNNVYPAGGGEVLIYMEPVGYTVKEVGPDHYQFGFNADVVVADKDGNILFGKENFMSVGFDSRHFNREIFLNITLNVTGIPAGEYLLGVRIRDTGGQETVAKVPVVFK